MARKLARVLLFALVPILSACGSDGGEGRPIKSAQIGAFSVTLSSADGVLRHGEQELTLTFKDASGKTVEVGAASLNFHMPGMGPMAEMNDAATLTTTATPGVYRARVKLEMAGEWQAQVSYEGAAGRGQGTFPVTVQ